MLSFLEHQLTHFTSATGISLPLIKNMRRPYSKGGLKKEILGSWISQENSYLLHSLTVLEILVSNHNNHRNVCKINQHKVGAG